MITLEYLYFLNLIVTTVLVIATLYRVKIEREMVRITSQNAKYREAMHFLIKNLEKEELSQEELLEALKVIIQECE